jgi:asparagine synthase (glutamine-hydrolysing)
MAVDAQTYLPDDVLVKVDRASMSVALEGRVPLLGREVVEHAMAMPLDLKIRKGVGKWALRELLARRLPRDIFDRPKSGFGIPIALWLRGPLRSWAEDLLSPSSLRQTGLLDPAPVRAAWDEHLSGRRDRSYDLWDVLMLESWCGRSSR